MGWFKKQESAILIRHKMDDYGFCGEYNDKFGVVRGIIQGRLSDIDDTRIHNKVLFDLERYVVNARHNTLLDVKERDLGNALAEHCRKMVKVGSLRKNYGNICDNLSLIASSLDIAFEN
jgi:hypothetical protein